MAGTRNAWTRTPYKQRRRIARQIFDRDGWTCQIRGPRCNGRAEEVDHIHQLTLGGNPLDPANMRAACRPCNRAGGARITNRRRATTRRDW